MKPRDWVFIAIVVGVIGGLYLLSQFSGRVPALSARAEHANAQPNREACLSCHTPERMSDLEAARKHPLKWRDAKINCTQCHKPSAPQKAQVPTSSNQIADLKFQPKDLIWLKQH